MVGAVVEQELSQQELPLATALVLELQQAAPAVAKVQESGQAQRQKPLVQQEV